MKHPSASATMRTRHVKLPPRWAGLLLALLAHHATAANPPSLHAPWPSPKSPPPTPPRPPSPPRPPPGPPRAGVHSVESTAGSPRPPSPPSPPPGPPNPPTPPNPPGPPSPPWPPSPPAPEPGMLPLPYFRSYFYPGPSPASLAQPFNLSLPGPPMMWFKEAESGIYRTPQARHVFGPFPTLPSALLLQGKIAMGGNSVDKGTQGALYVHQMLYYNGGAEMGWVYFNSNLRIASYFSTDANLKTQKWKSSYSLDSAFVNKQLSFRMGWDTRARTMSAQVYSSTSSLYNLGGPWPSWMDYDRSQPWYITITWQRNEDAVVLGLLSNASLWYIPGSAGTPAAPPQPQGVKGTDTDSPPEATGPPQGEGEPVPAAVGGVSPAPAPAPEPGSPPSHALAIGLGVGLGCVAVAAVAAAAVFAVRSARTSPAQAGDPDDGKSGTQGQATTVQPTAKSHLNPVFDASEPGVAALAGHDAGRPGVAGVATLLPDEA